MTPRERQVRISPADETWHLMRVLPYRTQENVIDGVIVSFVDVTGLKRAEATVKRSEQRFRSISDSDMIGIAFFDRVGQITQANHAFLSLVGYGLADVEAGRLKWNRLATPDKRDEFQRLIMELKPNVAMREREYEFVRHDGSTFWALFGCARTGPDIESESVAFLLDITHRKHL